MQVSESLAGESERADSPLMGATHQAKYDSGTLLPESREIVKKKTYGSK